MDTVLAKMIANSFTGSQEKQSVKHMQHQVLQSSKGETQPRSAGPGKVSSKSSPGPGLGFVSTETRAEGGDDAHTHLSPAQNQDATGASAWTREVQTYPEAHSLETSH